MKKWLTVLLILFIAEKAQAVIDYDDFIWVVNSTSVSYYNEFTEAYYNKYVLCSYYYSNGQWKQEYRQVEYPPNSGSDILVPSWHTKRF